MITERGQLEAVLIAGELIVARRLAVRARPDAPGYTRSVPTLNPAAAPAIWFIPPPAAGVYTAAEVAGMLGVAVATVRDYITRGRISRGRVIRLGTLRAPRGRIAPPALCTFLTEMSGLEVVVG